MPIRYLDLLGFGVGGNDVTQFFHYKNEETEVLKEVWVEL